MRSTSNTTPRLKRPKTHGQLKGERKSGSEGEKEKERGEDPHRYKAVLFYLLANCYSTPSFVVDQKCLNKLLRETDPGISGISFLIIRILISGHPGQLLQCLMDLALASGLIIASTTLRILNRPYLT